MDTTTVIGLALIIAVVIVALIIVFRQRLGLDWRLPFGFSLKVNGSNDKLEQPVGVRAKNIVSQEGGVVADDGTGRGVDATDVTAKDDVLLSSRPPQNSDPKAPPPA